MISPESIFRLCIRRNKMWIGNESNTTVVKIWHNYSLDLKAEERLLLYYLVREVTSSVEPFSWSVRGLAARFDASIGTAQKLMRKLKSAELVVHDDSDFNLGHRSKEVYKLSAFFSDMLSKYNAVKSPHALLQNRLLNQGRESAKLLRSNIWLLVVLLEHADEYGVVSTMSYGDIELMTGMSVHRIKSQIHLLTKCGFILSQVPGQKRAMFQISKPSVYFMNIRHDFFGDDRKHGFTFLISDDSIVIEQDELSFSKNFNAELKRLSGSWASGVDEIHKKETMLQRRIQTCLYRSIIGTSDNYFVHLCSSFVGDLIVIRQEFKSFLPLNDIDSLDLGPSANNRIKALRQELEDCFSSITLDASHPISKGGACVALSNQDIQLILDGEKQHQLINAIQSSILITAWHRVLFILQRLRSYRLDDLEWDCYDAVMVTYLQKSLYQIQPDCRLELFLRVIKNDVVEAYELYPLKFRAGLACVDQKENDQQESKQLQKKVASKALPVLQIKV